MSTPLLTSIPSGNFSRRSVRFHLITLAFFIILSFIVIHPQLFNNGTRVAGFDYFNYNWNMWWIRHALTTPGLNLYQSNFVMFPHLNNFGYHALTAFWFPVWAVLEPFVGTLTAMNAILLLGCILNGYLFFVFLLTEDVSPGVALIGAVALQVSPVVRYFLYNTHINLMDWFWLPAHLLLWKQIVLSVESKRTRRAIFWVLVQGIALWGLGHTDLQFPIFVGFLLVPYGLLTLWRSKHRPQLIAAGLLTVTVAFLLLWFAGPLPYMRSFTGTLAPGPVEGRPGIPFPWGYLKVYDVWWNWDTPTMGGFVTITTLISLVVSLSALRRRMSPDRWFWFACMIPPLLLSMGPDISIAGIDIPMPFRVLFAVTNGNFRMPWRLAPIFIVAAMTFVGKTWTPLVSRLPRRGLVRPLAFTIVILLLAVDIRLFQTGPLDPVLYPYHFYEAMGQERGKPYDDEVILEVPTGAGTGETLLGDPKVIQFQFYGMVHGKRMVNGFISRAPIENFWSMRTDDPLLSWLGQRRFLDPKLVEPELRQMIHDWPVGYIVIHEDIVGLTGPTNQEIIGYFNSLPDLLCPVFVEHDAVVFRTTWHPDGCPPRIPPEIAPGVYNIDIGAPGDEKYIGWGWHWQEPVPGSMVRWTGAYPQTQLYVDLPTGAYRLSLNAQSFYRDRKLAVLVNGVSVGIANVSVGSLKVLDFDVPAKAIGEGKHITVTLAYDGTDVPAEIGRGSDQRKLAVMVDWVRFSRIGQ